MSLWIIVPVAIVTAVAFIALAVWHEKREAARRSKLTPAERDREDADRVW